MKKYKFSVIIPVYNCEKYILRCVESVLNQSYSSFEIILINDGSTDDSLVHLQKLSKRDDRIILINKKNEGVSCARNDGLKIASGDLICFLDSDDYLSDGFFEETIRILNSYEEIELISFGYFSDIEDKKLNNKFSDKISCKDKLYKSKNEIKDDFVLLWDNTVLYNIWNKVYKAEIIKKNNLSFSNKYFGEDMEFNMKYFNLINCFYNSDKCFYHYIREREGAVTKKYKSDIFEIRKKEFEEINNYFISWEVDNYYEFSCRRYIERILGVIENVFCSKMSVFVKYKKVKEVVYDPITRECIKVIKPKGL